MSETSHYLIEAQDTWFFRESRPMESPGGSELKSVFPPPPRTVLGALRTAMGDAYGIDWQTFHDKHALAQYIGFGDKLGPLRLEGLWIKHEGERLYPAPALLLKTKDSMRFERIAIGDVVETHLGKLRLPKLTENQRDLKPLGQSWISEQGLTLVLEGKTPQAKHIIATEKLFASENRLGIARTHAQRTAEEGGLFQTQHLRIKDKTCLEVCLTHADNSPKPVPIVRLGGEGRLAYINEAKTSGDVLPALSNWDEHAKGLILILTSPALLRTEANHPDWLPDPSFKPYTLDGQSLWRGSLAGIELDLHCAVIGKAERQGGWDLAKGIPRDVQSLIPAGTCYYLTPSNAETKLADIQPKLHKLRLGQDTELGRGLTACGLWPASDDTTRVKPQ